MTHRNRAEREQLQYDAGIDRSRYNQTFSHCSVFATPLRLSRAIKFLAPKVENGVVLELGSSCWSHWLDTTPLEPKELHCINISHNELQTGIEKAERARLSPTFHLMDAHKLAFEDNTFDAVFGAGILHHLDLEPALSEIDRVLKPGGVATFFEPLDINPAGKLVRLFTPKARTEDEIPFTFTELRIVEKYLDAKFESFQFTSVPLGVISRKFFKRADNPLMRCAHRIDESLKTLFPPVRWLYRNMNIYAHATKNSD